MILESIVHLAIRLGLVVTAEGVESPANGNFITVRLSAITRLFVGYAYGC
jgi:EAL domain-containing protein (putative c-di-GMP-specific phosphodiesterase class I)